MEEILLKTLEGLMALTGVDRETALDIFSMYLNQTDMILKEIRVAFDKSPIQWGEIKNHFHKLKGSSGNVRQELLYELALLGENAAKNESLEDLSSVLRKASHLHQNLTEALENEMCR